MLNGELNKDKCLIFMSWGFGLTCGTTFLRPYSLHLSLFSAFRIPTSAFLKLSTRHLLVASNQYQASSFEHVG